MSPNITAGLVVKALLTVLANVVISYALTPKPKAFLTSGRNPLGTARGSITPWRVVYGKTRVGGTLVFQHREGTYLWLVIVLACHRVQDITEIWGDDRLFRGSATWSTGANNGSEAKKTWGGETDALVVRKYLGTQTTSDSELGVESSQWDSTHVLNGRAYVVMRIKDDTALWSNGLPNWSFEIEGKDDIYDPRDDTTKYTQNAALIQADYLFNDSFGVGVGAISGGVYTKIDDADLVAAANICDETVSLEAGGNEVRYEINGVFDVDGTHEDVIGYLLTATAGRCVFSEGTWHVHAGVHSSAVGDIAEADLAGPVQIQPRVSRSELFNGVKGTYRGVKQSYIPTDYPPVTNAGYETQDGGQLLRDLDLAFTTSHSMAQRLAKIELEDSRQQIVVVLRAKLAAYRFRPWDRVTLTLPRYGWNAKLFRVLETRIVQVETEDGPALAVDLTLKETVSTIYDWSAEENAHDAAPDTDLLDLTAPIGAVQNLVIATEHTYVNNDGIREKHLRITWDPPLDPAGLAWYEVRWRAAGAPPQGHRDNISTVGKNVVEFQMGPLTDALNWNINVAPISTNGVVGTTALVQYTSPDLVNDYTGRIDGRRSRYLRRRQESAFFESFDDVSLDPAWDASRGDGVFELNTPGIPHGGQTVAKMRAGNDVHVFYDEARGIPFDADALYRISARVMRSDSNAGVQNFTLGIEGLDTNGTTMVNFQGANLATGQYFVASDAFDMATIDEDVFHIAAGFFGGYKAGGADGDQGEFPAGNAPCELFEGTHYIRPVIRWQPADTSNSLFIDWIRIEVLDADGMRRVYTTLSRVFGRIRIGSRIERPSDTAALTRAMQTGTAQDGDTVTFSPAFDEVPEVSLIPEDVKTFENSWASSLDQKLVLRTTGLTATGFTMLARVSQTTSGITARTATLTDVSPPVKDVGDTTEATKTETVEAVDDVYTFQFDVYLLRAIQFDFPEGPITEAEVMLNFDARPSGGGSWTTYGSRSYTNNDILNTLTLLNETQSITVDGQAADSEFRIIITAETRFDKLEGDDVSWNEATAPINVTATPAEDNKVRWIALEGS